MDSDTSIDKISGWDPWQLQVEREYSRKVTISLIIHALQAMLSCSLFKTLIHVYNYLLSYIILIHASACIMSRSRLVTVTLIVSYSELS